MKCKRLNTTLGWLMLWPILGLLTLQAFSFDLDSKGTDFWLAFNENYTPNELSLFITGDINTSGTVSVPGIAFTTTFTVMAGAVTTVKIPAEAMLVGSDKVFNKGIHVTSIEEVSVYGLNRKQYTTDAFLGLPTDILGTEYLVLAYRGSGVQFAVVGTSEGTIVTIVPSAAGSHAKGVPYQVNLRQGEAYQLTYQGDLSGTLITSNKPVAVFSGNICTYVPPEFGACDHLVEQLPPLVTWGKSFVTVPLATRKKGDTFRFLSSADGTQVTVNGAVIATLNRGQVHEQIIDGSAQITSNKPILVAQFSNGSEFDGVTSDPFMMLIPPFEQFLNQYTVTTPANGFSNNFINVIARVGAVGKITLDGNVIPASSFSRIGNSDFSGVQVPVSLGSHKLSGPSPFGAFIYGFDSFDSYGYPGGMSLAPIVRVTNLALAPKASSGPIKAQHCVTTTISDQNSGAVAGVRIDFQVTGANPTDGFANSDNNGRAQFCYTGQNAGEDFIKSSVGNIADTASRIWTSCEPRVNLAITGGKAAFDLGPVVAGREVTASVPSDTFTVENFSCAPLSIKLQRVGADVASGKITNPDDSAIFSLALVNSNGAETSVVISPGAPPLQLAAGQTQTFRLRFHPLFPILSGKTSGLFANQAIPDVITSQLIVTPENGTPKSLNVMARVATSLQLIHPTDSRLSPLIVFIRTALEYTVECSVHDPNLDVYLARYQFLDQNDRPIGLPADVDLVQPIAQRGLVRGQSFTIIQKFTGSLQSNVAKVQVTLLDREATVVSAKTPLGTAEAVVASVSAASYQATGLASETMAAAFGANLSSNTQVATNVPLPTSLGGTSVRVRDGAGVERAAPLFFVSPSQVNYQIPPGTRVGAGTVSIMHGDQTIAREVVQVAAAAPALFSANSNGQGVAAAVALRIAANGAQRFDPIARFDQSRNQFVSLPLAFGSSSEQLFLVVFGAGLRFRNSGGQLSAKVGGLDAPIYYAGSQGSFVGLDQVNILLPRNLAGRGEVDVVLTLDGQQSNTVKVNLGGSSSATVSLDEWLDVTARNEARRLAEMPNRDSEPGAIPILRLPTMTLPTSVRSNDRDKRVKE